MKKPQGFRNLKVSAPNAHRTVYAHSSATTNNTAAHPDVYQALQKGAKPPKSRKS